MKIYISADMEGIAGVNTWDEVTKNNPEYEHFQKQMSEEVAAACRGANNAGAKEIVIKDAHETGRNILHSCLPENTQLIRGWSGHPLSMVQEIVDTFDAMFMIGYHSRAGGDGNPMAHTWSSASIATVKLNGKPMSEYAMHMLAGEYAGVPTVMVSGDKGLSEEIGEWNHNTVTVVTKEGIGNSTVNIHPKKVLQMIEKSAEEALRSDFSKCHVSIPHNLDITIEFKTHMKAYSASHYPGASLINEHTVGFTSQDYYDIMRFVFFAF